ncbi:MAG: prephenate dehydratase [Candidatus Omnitrophica bacterium]|nr:prephenate dehydratase [Candidatus Omnitrophota bacterium]
MKMTEIRKKIDGLDKKIVELLNNRAVLIQDIAEAKKKTKKGIYVPEREIEVYKKVVKYNKGAMLPEQVKNIYREIMSVSLALEKGIVVAFLGPIATFTQLAALKKFGSSVDYKQCGSITDIFSEVEKSNADFGVVPIENSFEGAVNHTLDMFIESELKICSEIYLNVTHYLLSKSLKLKGVKKIYSKSEVFGQCRRWLQENACGADLMEVSSTARAAQIAAKDNSSACIASKMAKDIYGLNILASSIEDAPYNVTRFLVIGKTQANPTGKDRTSIMFSIKDKIGALHAMLVPFKKHNINLTKIESRPSKKKAWDYYFFVDLEGHCRELNVKKALSELSAIASSFKILGSYPKA